MVLSHYFSERPVNMFFKRAALGRVCYDLGPETFSNAMIEDELRPVLRSLRIPDGYIAEVTGIEERRFWAKSHIPSNQAAITARRLMHQCDLTTDQIDMLCYTSVCRELFEPATACLIAQQLALTAKTRMFDLSNACLGFLDGIIQAAAQIELGWIKLAIVTACESSRDIIRIALSQLKNDPRFEVFAKTLATLTGGSASAACLVGDRETLKQLGLESHHLLIANSRSASEHARLCQWGLKKSTEESDDSAIREEFMQTDGVGVLKHGLALGLETWRDFKGSLVWSAQGPEKVITHQVGSTHRLQMLKHFGLGENSDFPTYRLFGNTGSASIPMSFALAKEQGFFKAGQEFGLLGIGSGLSTLMLGCRFDTDSPPSGTQGH